MRIMLPSLLKARTHKYVKRVKRMGRWVYYYIDPTTGGLTTKKPIDGRRASDKSIDKPLDTSRTEKYVNERPSDVKNVGEDVLGAARHKFDTYDLETLERQGLARKVINKKNLVGDYKYTTEKFDNRVKDGETLGKIVAVYKVKELLTSTPPDDALSRKKYKQFTRIVAIADENAKTATDFLTTIRNLSGVKPIMEKARELGSQPNQLPTASAMQKARDLKNISKDTLGNKLVEYMDRGLRNKRDPYTIQGLDDTDMSNKSVVTIHLAKLGIKFTDVVQIKKGDQISLNIPETSSILKVTKGRRDSTGKLESYEVKLGMKGTIESVSKGYAIIQVKGTDDETYRMRLRTNQLNLEYSVERGKINVKGKPKLEVEGKVERVGGKQVVSDNKNLQVSLSSEFNLRALQYGNSMTDDEREYHTKWTVESFYDLADITGIPYNKVSLNNRLAMAYGARGRAGALAHYEAGTMIINLTRHNGYGSLAHEWGHFLDNIASTVSHGKQRSGGFASNGNVGMVDVTYTNKENLPQGSVVTLSDGDRMYYDKNIEGNYQFIKLKKGETVPSSKNRYSLREAGLQRASIKAPVVDAVSSKIAEISNKLSSSMEKLKDYTPYYGRSEELLARAFECYVADSLENMGRKNTYLVAKDKTTKLDARDVYPQATLRKEINADFVSLFKMVNTSGLLEKAIKMVSTAERLTKSGILKPTEIKIIINNTSESSLEASQDVF